MNMVNGELIAKMEAALAILKKYPLDKEVLGRSGVGDDSGIFGKLLDFDVEEPRYAFDDLVLNALIRDENDEDEDDEDDEDGEGDN
jgi:hypothetical protein